MTNELRAFCAQYVPAALEALHGLRPVQQLAWHTSTGLLEKINRRASSQKHTIGKQRQRQYRVHKVHLTLLNAQICEATVIVHDGTRFHAAALRVELHRQRWMAHALQYA